MKKPMVLLGALVLGALLVSCAPGLNHLAGTPNVQGIVAGFWRGLWHGIIAPITFVISLFNSKVQMYEVHNNGGWYNFGFLLGVLGTYRGSHSGTSATRSWRRR